MSQTVFYPGLNDFCRKYFVEGEPLTPIDKILLPRRAQEQKEFLFEQMLLFDKISFKIYGENIALPLLLNFFGEKGLDSLIEQNAFRFVLWTPMVGYMVDNIPGVDTLVAGSLGSPAHSDPEQSIELGLGWMDNPLPKRKRRRLVKKLSELYDIPSQELPNDTVNVVKSAFTSGRLTHYGLAPEGKKLDTLTVEEKKLLSKCAEDLAEYKYLISMEMTSFSEYKYYSPFWDTIDNIKQANDIKTGFQQIAKVEGFPNLAAISSSLVDPLKQLPKLRQTRNAKKFREWMETNTSGSTDHDFVKAYIDAIANRKGLFDSAPAKFIKSISMAAIGAGIGALVGGPAGAVVGAASGGVITSAILESGSQLGIDLLDSFVVESLTKGWTPKMFFNEIGKLEQNKKPSGPS